MHLIGEQVFEEIRNDRFEIGTVKDLEKISEGKSSSYIPAAKQDSPSEFMSNWVEMETITLVSSSSFATTEYNWFDTLLDSYYNLLRYKWRYYHCDFEVCFDINSSPLDYGWFSVGWAPSSIPPNFDLVNSHPHIFDISTGGTHIIRIPYSSTYEAYDSRSDIVGNEFRNDHPRVFVTRGGMGTMAQTFSAQVRVRARMVNARTWGVINLDANTPAIAELQMDAARLNRALGPPLRGAAATARALGLTAAAGAAYMFSPQYEITQDNIDSIFGDPHMKAQDEQDIEEAVVSDPMNHNVPTFYSGMTDLRYKPVENLSMTMGRLPTRGLHDWSSHKILDLMQIPTIWTQVDMVSGSVWNTWVAPIPYKYPNYTFVGQRVDYLAQFSQLFRFWRGSIDYTFCFFTSPLITATILLSAGTTGAEQQASVPDPTTATGAFLYKRIVKVTGFTTVHVKVPYLAPFAWCPMEGKFTAGTPSRYNPVTPSYLDMRVQNISSGMAGSGAVPHVHCVVFRSAGEDFQVRNLAGGSFLEASSALRSKVAQLQSIEVNRKGGNVYENICGSTFQPTTYRYTPEDDFTIETLCHRWSYADFDTSGTHYPSEYRVGTNWYVGANPLPDLFFYLMGMFRYCRGCVQYKLKFDSTTTKEAVEVTMDSDQAYHSVGPVGDDTYISAGAALVIPKLNPIIEFQAPMESYTEWLRVGSSLVSGVTTRRPRPLGWRFEGDVSTDFDFAYARAGRGFQLAYLQPPLVEWNTIYRMKN